MPTEWKTREETRADLYIKKNLKWYEKIWYFVTGKKNKFEKLGNVEEIKYESND